MAYVSDMFLIIKGRQTNMLPSSRGLGHIPFTDATGIRIPPGVPFIKFEAKASFLLRLRRSNEAKFYPNPF